MSATTPSQESHDTQIEIQNENEATKTESSDRKNTNTVKIHEIHKQENTKDEADQTNTEVINMSKINTDVRKEVVHEYIGGNLPAISPPDYWVQFNFDAGNRIPDGGGAPLYYEPDRNLFVRIVFAIVLFMLILTAGFVLFVYMTDMKQVFRRYGMILMIIGMVGMIGLNYAMMCSACTRMPPCNYVCLFLAVSFMSLIAAYITTRYKTQIILLALLATTATVVVCLCLACTRFDFTQYLLYVVVIAAAFGALAMIISITMLVTKTRYKPLTLVILIVGTLINVVILTIELQMILGGRTVEISEDDYALGAFMLYTSIIDIFLKLVQILGIIDQG